MKAINRRASVFLIILIFVLIGSACTKKNDSESKGPSYQKNKVVKTDKSIKKQVLYIQNGQERIYGRIYTSSKVITKRPIAVVSHGLGGNYQELEDYAKNLAKKGYLAYTFDFPGGSSDSHSKGLKQTQMSIYSEEKDLLAVINRLRNLKNVDRNNIILVGGSQGGVVSALTASQHPEHIKGLALMYPAFSITHDAQKRYTSYDKVPEETDIFGFSVGRVYYQKLLNIDITKTATKYRGPVLIVHGTADDIVPIKYAKQAANNFPNAEFKKIDGAGHGFDGKNQQTALNYLDNFINKTQKK